MSELHLSSATQTELVALLYWKTKKLMDKANNILVFLEIAKRRVP